MVGAESINLVDRPEQARRAVAAAVGIGASAGGLVAIERLLAGLPQDFNAPIFVVLHVGSRTSEFPSLLARACALPCRYAEDQEEVRPGHVYVAPPNCHMIVEHDRILLTRGPRENWSRPSIDVLFRALAWEYGEDAVGVVLTGNLNDGTAGLYEVKRRGGIAIVQEPSEAEIPSMPQSALDNVDVDYRLTLAMIPQCLVEIADSKASKHETRLKGGSTMTEGSYRQDEPVALSCPECGGAMRQESIGALSRYRCHIGHALSAEDMAAGQVEIVERSLEIALRALNENRTLCQQLASTASDDTESLWTDAHEEAERRLKAIQRILDEGWTIKPRSTV